MGNTSTENYESISGAVQLVASQVGKYVGGPVGQAYATFLTGQNSWVASVSDLASKVQNGTATGEDFADVASKTASTLAGFGVLTGTAAPWTLVAAGAAGGALWAWKNRELIGEKVLDGYDKIKELTIDRSEPMLQEVVVSAEALPYEPYEPTNYGGWYWEFHYSDDLPEGTVSVGDLISEDIDGTDYNQDGTSYQ